MMQYLGIDTRKKKIGGLEVSSGVVLTIILGGRFIFCSLF
jgi:hypothetical protein